jgi:hypothetical protein
MEPEAAPAETLGPRPSAREQLREAWGRARARLRKLSEPFTTPGSRASRILRVIVEVACVLVAARTFFVLGQLGVYSVIGYDEQYFIWTGFSVNKGLAPYAEAFEYKPPMLFYTQALALKLLGFKGMGYRWFFLGLTASSVLAVQFSLVRRGVHVLHALGFAMMAAWFFTDPGLHDAYLGDSESIALAYYYWGLAFLVGPFRRRSVTDAIGGAFMACAVLSKEPVALAVIATWAACFLLSREEGPLRVRAKRYLLATGAGVAAVVVVLVILMLPRGGLRGYIALVESYRTYSDPTKSVCAVLGRFQPTTFWLDLPKHWDRLRVDYLNIVRLGPVAPFLAAALVSLLRRSLLLTGLSLLVFAAGFTAVSATGCYWVHYYVMAQTGIFAVVAMGLIAMPASSLPRGVGLWSGAFFLTLAVAAAYPRYEVEAAKKRSHPALPISPHVLAFVEQHSARSDRIWTTGAPGVYVFANRLSATRESAILDDYLVQYPGESDEEKLKPLREQLERHRPKVVIIDRSYQQRKQRHFRTLVFPFLKANGYRELEKDLWVSP